MSEVTNVAIVGGGIAGLALALNLHGNGIDCRVYESSSSLRELGVGITMLPHAMRELAALGLDGEVADHGIQTKTSSFFNRFGQLIYSEPRGKWAGYPYPEVGIHRGRLHGLLASKVIERLGPHALVLGQRCLAVSQSEDGAVLNFVSSAGGPPTVKASVVIGCDGVNSAIREQYYPNESLVFSGVNTWRGATRRKPILDGRTYMRVGSIRTAKMVIYPMVDDVDGSGDQLINWAAEVTDPEQKVNDWNRRGRVEDVVGYYRDWTFDWLNVPELIANAEVLLEYPMVDKDPINRWTFDRVTLAGDAAHPMYPRGSNGSAQALIDVRVLADELATHDDPRDALKAYEAARSPATAKVVRTNREAPPDYINIVVEERTHDKPFDQLSDFISQDELRAIADKYRNVAGYDLARFERGQ